MLDQQQEPRRSPRLAAATLLVACVGSVGMPFGIVLAAWSFLVSLVIVISSVQGGRRVPRAALAALIVSVAGPLAWGLLLAR
jgi:hypothetical protein